MNELDEAGVGRLTSFFAAVGAVLGAASRRASFATYAMGLLSDAERKSVEPIAARDCPDPSRADAAHQRLLHFVGNGDWDDHQVRLVAAEHGVAAMTPREKVEAWIIDDTGFLKQGRHSVGVQRQYTGSAGKIANCQIGTSLTIATKTEQLPIDFELYLPKSWTEDPDRCRKAGVPEDVIFKTKTELALDMIRRAVAAGIPPGVVLGDTAYGASSDFRRGVRELDLHYSLGIDPKTTVWEIGNVVARGGAAINVRDLAFKLMAKGRFRRCTWRAGTKEDLTARFAMRRVFPCREQSRDPDDREPVWLLIEWRDGEDEPANYFFSSLPKTTRRKRLVPLTMQRWRTERAYEDMKGELGLDHYEGRGFRGWHHHVSVITLIDGDRIELLEGCGFVESAPTLRGLKGCGGAPHKPHSLDLDEPESPLWECSRSARAITPRPSSSVTRNPGYCPQEPWPLSHVSVVLCCYAFVVSERVRRFPPSARGPLASSADRVAA